MSTGSQAMRALRLSSTVLRHYRHPRLPARRRPLAAASRPQDPSVFLPSLTLQRRWATSSSMDKSVADIKVEEITELFATAQDEFEIAFEETEKVSVYAEEDRQAAREEFEKVKHAYTTVAEGEDRMLAEEIQRRVGQRIRELEQGIERMEEMAREQD